MQFTISPGSAIIVIGRITPSFQVMSWHSSGKSGASNPPQAAQRVQLTPYFDCGLEPSKSKVSLSPRLRT